MSPQAKYSNFKKSRSIISQASFIKQCEYCFPFRCEFILQSKGVEYVKNAKASSRQPATNQASSSVPPSHFQSSSKGKFLREEKCKSYILEKLLRFLQLFVSSSEMMQMNYTHCRIEQRQSQHFRVGRKITCNHTAKI